jgi:MFS family permease
MQTVIRNKMFQRLWIAQIVLTLGDAMMQMGLLELFRRHGFNVERETAKLLFAVALPGVVFGPLAIAYLGRWQRRNVLALSDVLRGVMVAVVAFWLLPKLAGPVEKPALFPVYALIFVIGVVTTFYYPARYAFLPDLIPAEKLIQANTLFTTSLAVAGVVGRPLGGLVAELFGVWWAVMANAAAYFVGAWLVWRIPTGATPKARAATKPPGGWDELRDGLVYLWRHPVALQLTLLAGVFMFLGGVFIVAFTGYSYNTLKLGTAGLGYLAAAAGPGAALGVLAMGRAGKWTKSAWLPFGQLVSAGGVLMLLGQTTHPWVAAPLLTLLGGVVATAFIPIDAKLQEQVDDERRGAVFAARGMWTSVTTLVAFWLRFGTTLLEQSKPGVVMTWLGVAAIGSAVLTLLVVRRRG